MLIYIVMALFSILFFYLDQNVKRRYIIIRNKKFNCISICGFIAIIIPSVVAGLRDYSVGVDTSGYGKIVFRMALHNNFRDFYNSSNIFVKNVEPIYRIIVYIITELTSNIFWQFFIIEFIIVYFVYKALYDKKYACFGMFIFYCLFFCFSLNLMRQTITMAILLYGFRYIKERKIIKYILVVAISSLITTSALIGIFVYPLFFICGTDTVNKYGKKNNFFSKHRKMVDILILGVTFLVFVFTPKLIEILSIIKSSYGYQLDNISTDFNISYAALLMMLILEFPFFIYYRKANKKGAIFNFYTLVFIMATILWQTVSISQESYRVSLYLWFYIILAIPDLMKVINKKALLAVYYSTAGMAYFFLMFVYYNINSTVPYVLR